MMELIQQRNAIGCQLVSDALHLSGAVRVRVLGGSMLPSVLPGDILVVRRDQDPAPGDIVLFTRDDRLFAHRVVARGPQNEASTFLTKGDSLRDVDPPLASSNLLGRVASIQRGTREWNPRRTIYVSFASAFLAHFDFLKRGVLWLLNRSSRSRDGRECQI
jgi:hypothetical protein